jgi:methylated-DNA-[protein]-cysteine S-methyltransferase
MSPAGARFDSSAGGPWSRRSVLPPNGVVEMKVPRTSQVRGTWFTQGSPMEPQHYIALPSNFGTLAIVWQVIGAQARVWQIWLPRSGQSGEQRALATQPTLRLHSHPDIARVGEQVQRFLQGQDVTFDLACAALERCSRFQQRVLVAEHGIPRGWVSTYGRIARHLGVPAGARAVGRSLARNPFPIIIPCHRAVRANGELGGYQGGVAMKRALLELEGVPFTAAGRVAMRRVHY